MLKYTQKVKVKISKFEYIKKLVDRNPDDMQGTAKIPAANNLLKTNPDCVKLPEKTDVPSSGHKANVPM